MIYSFRHNLLLILQHKLLALLDCSAILFDKKLFSRILEQN